LHQWKRDIAKSPLEGIKGAPLPHPPEARPDPTAIGQHSLNKCFGGKIRGGA
ncbi:Hypothetical predicted protein, partial [Marmota monax]